jgi:hypothetical protein
MDDSAVTIVVGLVSSVATISAALITRSHAVPQPQLHTVGSLPLGGQQPTVSPGLSYQTPSIKTSRSLWWGLAGIFLWLLPILGYIVTLPGLFIAIRDVRSPGTRRYSLLGLVLCMLALVLTIINSAIGAYQGAHGVGWWQNG